MIIERPDKLIRHEYVDGEGNLSPVAYIAQESGVDVPYDASSQEDVWFYVEHQVAKLLRTTHMDVGNFIRTLDRMEWETISEDEESDKIIGFTAKWLEKLSHRWG